MEQAVGVIGGGGHIGLGLCLVLASHGFRVYGIDSDESVNAKVMRGEVPFIEHDAEKTLHEVLAKRALQMTTDLEAISSSAVVIIVVGTPVDENLNPVFEPLNQLCRALGPKIQRGQLLILRSTVPPGTTRRVRNELEALSGMKESEDFFLVSGPERVAQGQALREIVSLPQLVGAFSDEGFRRAEAFFSKFVQNKCHYLTPEEAEIGKLITNISRYVGFALANEYYLLADRFQVNIHRILDACNHDYPRLSVPNPGPNVGGPCLYKDGFFLTQAVPFPEILDAAFKINEGMTFHIVTKIREQSWIHKVGILGMAFKAGSDDVRYSLSFKLKKQLRNSGFDVACYDPLVPTWNHLEGLSGSDCLVLMTPHAEFKQLNELLRVVNKQPCLLVDIWGFWERMRGRSRNGFFLAEEVKG